MTDNSELIERLRNESNWTETCDHAVLLEQAADALKEQAALIAGMERESDLALQAAIKTGLLYAKNAERYKACRWLAPETTPSETELDKIIASDEYQNDPENAAIDAALKESP